jgi:hypothetical protein
VRFVEHDCRWGVATALLRFVPIKVHDSPAAPSGDRMPEDFLAQSLVETKTVASGRRFEMTFVDAGGVTQTISIPSDVAADLVPVLVLLADKLDGRQGPTFTRMPKQWAVGHAHHERLVLIRFDDEPAYGLSSAEAAHLWREVRAETEAISRLKTPARQ